jgi:hypothetical protein
MFIASSLIRRAVKCRNSENNPIGPLTNEQVVQNEGGSEKVGVVLARGQVRRLERFDICGLRSVSKGSGDKERDAGRIQSVARRRIIPCGSTGPAAKMVKAPQASVIVGSSNATRL